jgi:hypothetical protein
MQDRINSNSSSTRKTQELCPLDDLKAKDAVAARKQTSLILLIPNQPLSRQGKSLDYELATFLVKLWKNIGKIAPLSRARKYHNSSKSHLFQELESTLIFK